jgi:hypothetical protein
VIARARLAAWLRRRAAEQKRHRSFWHWLFSKIVNSQTETLQQTNAYAWSRGWLRPYMTGWVRAVIEWENIIFLMVTTPLRALGIGYVKALERQSVFWIVVLAAAIAFIIWLSAHH